MKAKLYHVIGATKNSVAPFLLQPFRNALLRVCWRFRTLPLHLTSRPHLSKAFLTFPYRICWIWLGTRQYFTLLPSSYWTAVENGNADVTATSAGAINPTGSPHKFVKGLCIFWKFYFCSRVENWRSTDPLPPVFSYGPSSKAFWSTAQKRWYVSILLINWAIYSSFYKSNCYFK